MSEADQTERDEEGTSETSMDERDSEGRDSDGAGSDGAGSDEGAGTSRTTAGGTKSAGARLAAAKAAKAAVKAAAKAERKAAADANAADGELVETPVEEDVAPVDPEEAARQQLESTAVGRATLEASSWAASNQNFVLALVGTIVVLVVGIGAYQFHQGSQAAAAGVLLDEAVRISNAQIVAAGAETADDDADDDDDDDAPTFATRAERNEAALRAYERVVSEHPGSRAASIASVSAARVLLDLGRFGDAESAYEELMRTAGQDSNVALIALEGLGAAQEAQNDMTGARETYERLESVGGDDSAETEHPFALVAKYHLARLHLAAGEEDQARTLLHEVVDGMRTADTAEPPFPYVLAQAESRLREIDPTAAADAPSLGGGPGGGIQLGGPGGGLPAGMTQEQLDALLQSLRQQGQPGGSAPEL